MKKLNNKKFGGTIALILYIIAAVALILSIASIFKPKKDAYFEGYQKVYHNYEVQYGDTLTSIRDEWNPGRDIGDFVYEVQHINHMVDDKIVAGKHIIIPYRYEDLQPGCAGAGRF